MNVGDPGRSMNINCPATDVLRRYNTCSIDDAAMQAHIEQHLQICTHCQIESEGWYRAQTSGVVEDAVSLLLFF